jgi:putative transposase
MMFPLVADLAADKIPVAVTCRVLGFSKQAFYPVARQPLSNATGTTPTSSTPRSTSTTTTRSSATGSSPTSSPASGSPLAATASTGGAPNSACQPPRPQTWPPPQARPPVHDDLVARRCTAPAPDRLWLTDITEHPTTDAKL